MDICGDCDGTGWSYRNDFQEGANNQTLLGNRAVHLPVLINSEPITLCPMCDGLGSEDYEPIINTSDQVTRARASKLSTEAILDIRKRYVVNAYPTKGGSKTDASIVIELARQYGVTQESIRNVANRKTFKWVK